ncbi:hypothetical protein CBR_g49036 [Chara braunii]|uniref:Uncharacterized protein n=1 Tax=Chara braunii TaxID=69332 RepID=A0A388M454_CHABU|nr:hypothetical protein CBR_g49036 [Chara braunii]|eukprot:GBG89326.1 hypothetical protein CBR_g49036 [Chara braunii]
MPQPPAGGQHPGGGGGGDGGNGSGSSGGGDGGDGLGSGADKAEGKGSGGEGSGEKRSVEKWLGETSSKSKGSGGKMSGGKGSGGKRTVFGSHESTGTESHCEGTAPGEEELSQEAHAVQQDEELLQGSSGNTINIRDTEEVLHSGSLLTTQEGDVNGGQWTFVEGEDCGEEVRAWTFVEARLLGEEEGEEEPVVEARLHGDEEGEEPVVEARLFGGEVSVGVQMDPERKDHDSPSTRCGEEQGDRASVLSTGRKIVLHKTIELVSDSVAIELVSDSVVAEVQNIESSVDVGTVERQEADFPRRTPEHGVRLSMSLPMKPSKAMRGKSFSGRSLAALPKKSSSSVGLFKRVQMSRLFERVVRVLNACGIGKEEALQKHVAASIESVTALSDRFDDDAKRCIVKDPYPKYTKSHLVSRHHKHALKQPGRV